MLLDLLFEITGWLRETFLLDLAFWMMETPLSLFMVENFWNVPLAQVVHIVSIGAAFGALIMLSLRVHGKAAETLPMDVVAKRYVPWVWYGLLGIVISGLLMLTAEPLRNMINAVFWIKMILLLITVVITLGFFKSVRAQGAGGVVQAASGTRNTALALIVLWLFIMLAGRWIAYIPV